MNWIVSFPSQQAIVGQYSLTKDIKTGKKQVQHQKTQQIMTDITLLTTSHWDRSIS